MNKIILKKVALGLFLAGYSISGAYAADTVSTKTDYILGHAPLVNSANIQPDFTNNSIDIKVLNTSGNPIAAGETVKNGYTIQLSYKIADQDGDTDPNLQTAKTVRFAYKDKGASNYKWVEADSTSEANGVVTVSWTIPAAAIGSRIYYGVIPNTKYGNPKSNLQVYGNVFNSGMPGTRPEGEGGTNPTDENTGTGGGDTPTPPIDIIEPDTNAFAITIYEATISGGAVTMSGNSLSASSHPEVGKTYAAKVTLDENNVTKDITTQFAIQWSLVDFNGDAINATNSTSADVADLKATSATYQDATRNETVTNIAYTIPVNNQVMTANNATVTGLYAGAQGFKLKAEAIQRP